MSLRYENEIYITKPEVHSFVVCYTHFCHTSMT